MLKVIDKGTTKYTKVSVTFGVLTAAQAFSVSETVVLVNIAPVDEITKKSFAGTATKAAIGSLVLGPIGLLAGALGSGKKEITSVLEFDDGGQLVAKMDHKTYAKLVGIAIKNQEKLRQKTPIMPIMPKKDETQPIEIATESEEAEQHIAPTVSTVSVDPNYENYVVHSDKPSNSINQQTLGYNTTKNKPANFNNRTNFIILTLVLFAILFSIAYWQSSKDHYVYKSKIDLPQHSEKKATNTTTNNIATSKKGDNEWKNSTEYYNAYAEKGHSPDYIERVLPLKYAWIQSAKDVLTAACDFGYFSAEYQVKAANGEFDSDEEKLKYGANLLADCHYIEWIAKKYNVSPQKRNKAIQKGINEFVSGK